MDLTDLWALANVFILIEGALMKKAFSTLLIYIINFLNLVGTFLILLIMISFATQLMGHVAQYSILGKIKALELYLTEPFIDLIKMIMPYRFQGTDYSEVILFFIIAILLHVLSGIKYKIQENKNREIVEKNYQEWRSKMNPLLQKDQIKELDTKFAELNVANKSDRKRLIKEFALLKQKLDSMGQQLAFLSIDVVDSTGMKRNEDKHIAAYDFEHYNDLLISCLKENNVIKYTITPDGMMCCFTTVDGAVNAATCLMDRLEDFNRNVKQIKRDFLVRCGINAGFVYIDEEMPLEQISDRVIDIAGHMQKNAKPNTINIAGSAIEPLKHRGGFSETSNVIDEEKVYEWTK